MQVSQMFQTQVEFYVKTHQSDTKAPDIRKNGVASLRLERVYPLRLATTTTTTRLIFAQDVEILKLLTAIYGRQPTSIVFAMESTRRPEIPKSQSLNSPSLLTSTLEGFTSARKQ